MEVNKKYQIIYADPPWKYEFCHGNMLPIENHYPTMSLKEIQALSIPAAENAILFLWATTAKLDWGIDVLRSWGFTYRSSLVWDKEIIGCGSWFRGQHEILLVGRKGNLHCPPQKMRVSSVLRERRGKHSKKPSIIRYWIKRWYPNCSKIELFARREELLFDAEDFDGWDVWGNEVESDIKLCCP